MALSQVFNAVVLLFQVVFIYIIALFIYRLTLHPLAKYPGPFLAKLTSFAIVPHYAGGDIHLECERLFQKYGKLVRLGPNRLLINSAKAYHDIYDANRPVKKVANYKAHGEGNLIGMINKEEFLKKKKVFGLGFSDSRVRESETKILDKIGQFCDEMVKSTSTEIPSTSWQEPKDMSVWNIFYSTTWNLLTSRENARLVGIIRSVTHVFAILHSGPLVFALLFKMYNEVLNYFNSGSAIRMEALKIVSESMAIRKANPDIDDVFGQQLNHKDPETGKPSLTWSNLVRNSVNFIIVGSDTSAGAIAAIFFYLSHHPDAYAAVAAEVRAAFPTVQSIRSGPTLQNCKLLNAAIMETLRISPPGIIPYWREVEEGGITIDGEFLPAGVEVASPIYSLHHDPKIFPGPYKFDISRFIKPSSSSSEENEAWRLRNYAWNPFSTGPRVCLAKNFALMEIALTMATVLVRTDFRLAPGELGRFGEGGWQEEGWAKKTRVGRGRKEEFQLFSSMAAKFEGPWLEFRERSVS